MIHPIINLFQQRAELLDIQNSKASYDDAISDLAGWIDANDELTEDDLTFLVGIGGILFREQLKTRLPR